MHLIARALRDFLQKHSIPQFFLAVYLWSSRSCRDPFVKIPAFYFEIMGNSNLVSGSPEI